MEPMVTSILVGVDGSGGAELALDWAAALVDGERAEGNRPRAVAAIAWSHPLLDDPALLAGDDLACDAAARLDASLVRLDHPDRFERVVRRGSAAEVLLEEAATIDADLIVVGTRGRGALAQLLLGSVSRTVAARADRAVAVVPAGAEWAAEPTVVGFDDSPGSRAALRWAVDHRRGQIKVVSAWYLPTTAVYDPEAVDVIAFEREVRSRLETGIDEVAPEARDRIVPIVQRDDPRLALLDSSLEAAMIVLGARAEHGVKGLLLGSTVDYVVGHSPDPVVIVPPPDGRPEDG
jgi:nucleotide-binding universal stress UspA family protein